MAERTGVISAKGNPLTLVGDEAFIVGKAAPDVTLSKALTEDIKLSDFRGKTLILSTVPSLDTSVCSNQTAWFNQEATNLGDGVVILTVSMDLPMAQARWCEANKAENITTASDYKHREFACKSGLYIKELGLLARSVHIIDKDGVVRYSQIVKEVPTEPDYEAVLAALKDI